MSRGDVRIGAELIGIDRINRLVADLQDIDRNKAIKAGLRKEQVYLFGLDVVI